MGPNKSLSIPVGLPVYMCLHRLALESLIAYNPTIKRVLHKQTQALHTQFWIGNNCLSMDTLLHVETVCAVYTTTTIALYCIQTFV